ncbi:hypothetical protein NQ317_001192 [Molorchus minor]|uniref:Uncharacterized protein n=1 Tax=Molorchus minor TaxID=1323400 RepID=A0ABQ9JGX3_9CUCU|nr:hypothetical protein NQ317_001192 [Molorchus minor]
MSPQWILKLFFPTLVSINTRYIRSKVISLYDSEINLINNSPYFPYLIEMVIIHPKTNKKPEGTFDTTFVYTPSKSDRFDLSLPQN